MNKKVTVESIKERLAKFYYTITHRHANAKVQQRDGHEDGPYFHVKRKYKEDDDKHY